MAASWEEAQRAFDRFIVNFRSMHDFLRAAYEKNTVAIGGGCGTPINKENRKEDPDSASSGPTKGSNMNRPFFHTQRRLVHHF
jgi:hypothetical protein